MAWYSVSGEAGGGVGELEEGEGEVGGGLVGWTVQGSSRVEASPAELACSPLTSGASNPE